MNSIQNFYKDLNNQLTKLIIRDDYFQLIPELIKS